MARTVFVVATHTEGTGGFDWFYKEPDALANLKVEEGYAAQFASDPQPQKYKVKYVGTVEVPSELDRDGITNWLDTEGFELWDNP